VIGVKHMLNFVDVIDALTIAHQCIAQRCHERATCSSCAARRNT
jgi:hypothetical protein